MGAGESVPWRAVDVALREIRYGRVWRVNACRLVDERDGVLALWSPAGIERLVPVDDAGAEIRIPFDEPWVLGERTTAMHSLALLEPARAALAVAALGRRTGTFRALVRELRALARPRTSGRSTTSTTSST